MSANNTKEIYRLNYLIGETDAAYHELALTFGLSDSVMRILYAICDMGDPSPLAMICRRSGLSKQTVNSALRHLEKDGIVYLEQRDAKHKNVRLTDAGKALADRTARQVLEAENTIFSEWPTADREQYLALTERFLVGLREKTKEIKQKI